MGDIEGLRTKLGWVARPGWGPAPPVPIWAAWPPSLTSCAPYAYHDKIFLLTPKKIRGQFEFEKVPKTSKYAK
jgi:hypothetical protein